jgi:hypothetical protein
MPRRQNARKLRKRFFGAVLLIAGDQHDTLAVTGTSRVQRER